MDRKLMAKNRQTKLWKTIVIYILKKSINYIYVPIYIEMPTLL